MRFHNYILFLSIIALTCNHCHKKDLCEDFQNVYLYPKLPENHTMTSEEVDRYVDLPSHIAKCMSTDTLIETILDYPYIGLFFAGPVPQIGYEVVKSQFTGLKELESRTDKGKCLLKRYQNWNPLDIDTSWSLLEIGNYMVNGANLEIIQSQYSNLRNLDTSQFKELFLRSLEIYRLEQSQIKYYGYQGLVFSTTTLARMMLLRKYDRFLEVYSSDVLVLNITETYAPPVGTTLNLIYELAVEYSRNL